MLPRVGLETFVDPRNGGGAVDDISTEPQVELMESGGEEILYYPTPCLTVALLRGTTADEMGNVAMEREALVIDNLAQAMAVKNAGGVVILQVERVVLAGTFTACGFSAEIADGALKIVQEGRSRKFLEAVEQVTFSGTREARLMQSVLHVIERAVFELTTDGLRLIEVAPGADLDRDILTHMETRLIIDEIAQMGPRIFSAVEMGLRVDLLHLDLAERVALHPDGNRLFLNFEKMRIRIPRELEKVAAQATEVCKKAPGRVDVIVSYDGFSTDETLEADWARMVSGLQGQFFNKVFRHSGSAFMRMKLQEVFSSGRSHIFESSAQALAFLDS
ncbi:hypothetical protein GG681_15125 [Epibacterium sp. SM1969]|uniref:Uncharacterized protein n=2 Tax=Tritonibacter aquimaris TaxID=2663379 RepID=A0A844AVS4_9RHOB|nr:hypothetical protein [Tritonibacter aquimaris]